MNIIVLNRYCFDAECMWYTENVYPVHIPKTNLISWSAHSETDEAFTPLKGTMLTIGCIGSASLQSIFVRESPEDVTMIMRGDKHLS